MRDLTAHEHLPGIGETAETCSEVERPATVTAVHANGLTCVQADADSKRERRIGHRPLHELTLQFHGGTNSLARRVENGERLVTSKLDHPSAGGPDRRTRHLCEPRGETRSRLVATLLRESRVATDVSDEEREDGARLGLSHPAIICRGFSLA